MFLTEIYPPEKLEFLLDHKFIEHEDLLTCDWTKSNSEAFMKACFSYYQAQNCLVAHNPSFWNHCYETVYQHTLSWMLEFAKLPDSNRRIWIANNIGKRGKYKHG